MAAGGRGESRAEKLRIVSQKFLTLVSPSGRGKKLSLALVIEGEGRVKVRRSNTMLRLPEFNYIQPRSLKQATNALADLGTDAMLVAGGTDVYPKMKRGQFTPRHLISLRSLRELKGIRQSPEGLWIGAGESLTTVSNHRLIAKHFPALAHAAESVSTPQLRNMGTIGGNVFVDTRCNYYDQTFFWRQAVGFCMKKDGQSVWLLPAVRSAWRSRHRIPHRYS